ncbi:MAG TPA: flippase activity-associated protein Agl23 [Candidatus Kryptonia bacterium]|nr:flippase activity-associated protein Agl23 [Candidatus Kryptonia bacterium]
MAESALDRKLVGRWTAEQCLYIGVLIVATFLRLYILGERPYHHDESIHAFFSWKITQQGVGDYQYDPVYHGPLLYYSTALMLWLFGDSDFTGRLSAVAFGMGVLAFAWPLRRYLGRVGALTFLVLATFSPSFNYFSRFVRHDIYVALCNLSFVYFAFRYGETRVARYLYLCGASLALAFCTKEDMYVLAPIFVIAFVLMLVWEVVYGSQTVRGVVGEITELLGRALVPLITTAIIFVAIWVLFYTSMLSHPKNYFAVGRALSYWMGQHEIKRIGGPWYYYIPQLTLYDPLVLFAAAAMIFAPFVQSTKSDSVLRAMRYSFGAGALVFVVLLLKDPASHIAPVVFVALLGVAQIGVARVWLPDRFTRFAILWTLGSLCFYGWAQEKVPWLLVPQMLPLLIVAAMWFAQQIESGAMRRAGTAIPIAAVGALTIWILIASNYLYDAPRPEEPADHRTGELLAYVQSTYDIHTKVMKRIEQAAATLGTGTQTRLAVSGDATWPLSWYLRHYPVNWAADVRNVDTPVIIVNKDVTNSLDQPLGDKYEKIPFEIRGWWEPAWNQANLPKFMKWLFTRQVFSGVGSSDAVMYVAKDIKPGMAFAAIPVNPPPAARGYPQQPKLLSAAAIWGKQGSAPGDFNEPRGLAIDGSGNIYVIDSKNDRVQKLGPDGRSLLAWGKEGNGPGEFKDPCGITVTSDGTVYVADTWNHRIQKFDTNGRFLLQWSEENPGFWGPRGIAVAPDGTVYVTDTGNKRVLAYSPDGKQKAVWGKDGSKPGELIEPVGIAVDATGNVYVADTGNHRIQIFDAKGTFKEESPVFGWEEFYTEPYIAVNDKDVYVTDSNNQRFARYTDKQFSGAWGKSGSGSGDFNRPIGIAVDQQGNVYVSDTMNHRIQKFTRPPQ